jgi:hypothetical protein
VSKRISLTAASLWHLRLYLQYVTGATSSLVFLIRRAGTLIAVRISKRRAVLCDALFCNTAAKVLDNEY